MHDTRVKMKDGREFVGPLWEYNERHWYLTIPSDTDEKLYFRDMESAVEGESLETASTAHLDIDLLARARRHGWDGVT